MHVMVGSGLDMAETSGNRADGLYRAQRAATRCCCPWRDSLRGSVLGAPSPIFVFFHAEHRNRSI